MPENPYQPPSETNERPELTKVKWWQSLLLKLVAIGLFLIALTIAAGSVDALSRPDMVARRVLTPGLFWATTVVAIGLPVTSLVLFGVACWRRSKPLAYAGLRAIGLIALYILCIFLFGTIRRWIAS